MRSHSRPRATTWSGRDARRTGHRAAGRLSVEQLENREVLSAMSPVADFLYVGNAGPNTVERFDADSGAFVDTFVKGNKSLSGPMGLIFDGDGQFLVSNQNLGRGKPGEIMQYDAGTGEFQGELVPFQDPNALFAPRGIVLKDDVLYVANLSDSGETKAGFAPDGRVATYDGATGEFLGDLTPPAGIPGLFNPRGIVFGPDDKLYVSVFDSSNLAAGHIVQFDLGAGTSSVFAANDGDGIDEPGEAADLHRPEGLTFGPDGRLYVTSFRENANDIDRVLLLNGATGAQEDAIELDQVGQPRAFAQAIVFGPGDDLYVPIAGNGPDSGAVRRYDVVAKTFTNFVAPGIMTQAWYATFGNTDPATLAYVPAAPLAAPSAAQALPMALQVASGSSLATDGELQSAAAPAEGVATSSVSSSAHGLLIEAPTEDETIASRQAREQVFADESWFEIIDDDLLSRLVAAV